MLVSSALVLFMTPGLAFFYAGMVRAKNVMSVLMQSFVACGLVTLQWFFFGYSLAFGPDHFGLIGDFSWAFLHHVSAYSADPNYGATVPHQVYCIFQLMFAIITPALISGAVVERMKFGAYLVFIFLWATFIYDPLAHWVWGHNGWLGNAHLMDFAGGTVVEMASGFSALAIALVLGKRRRSDGTEDLRPHNLPLTLVGVGILWFGWFGFNAGSGVNVGHIAVSSFINTHLAGAAAAFTWLCLDWIIYKKPTALGFGSGVVSGLVAITPSCGFVGPVGAFWIGVGAAFVCFFAIRMKNRIDADDSMDVFGVHGCGGVWGLVATGLFAIAGVNAVTNGGTGHNGLLEGGNFALSMMPQLEAIVATALFCFVGTFVIAHVVQWVCGGLRASEEEEVMGLDLTDHGEQGYGGASGTVPGSE
jgi:Amt family ammonium transporter